MQLLRRPADAEAEYRRALTINPNAHDSRVMLGAALLQQGKNAEGEVELRRALEANPNDAVANDYLGRSLFERGQLPEAEQAFRRAIAAKPDLDVARLNLGHCLFHQDRPAEAETEFLAALKLAPDDVSTLQGLHKVRIRLGRPADTLPLFERIRQGREARLGPYHQDTIQAVADVAGALRMAGKHDDGVELLKLAVERSWVGRGLNDPNTGKLLKFLDEWYQQTGRAADRVALWERVWDQRSRTLPPDHQDTLNALNCLAMAYMDGGQPGRAVELLEPAQGRFAAAYGLDHRDTLIARQNLGVAYQNSDRYVEAIPHLEYVLAVARVKLAPNDTLLSQVKENLVSCYDKTERYDQLAGLRTAELAAARLRLPADSPVLARRLAELGLLLVLAGKPGQAEQALWEALGIFEQKVPENFLTFWTRIALGGALVGLRNYDAAEPLLQDGYRRLKEREAKLSPQARLQLARGADWLAELYDAWGKPEEATKWRAVWQTYQPEQAPPPRPTVR